MYTISNLYLVVVLTTTVICQNVNEKCVLLSNNSSGTCRFSSECPEVDRLTKQGIHVQLCGFHLNLIPIFCCQDNLILPPSAPPPLEKCILSVRSSAPTVDEEFAKSYSEELCVEYSKDFTSTSLNAPLIQNPEISSNTGSICEKNTLPLISNGMKASLKEFPYMASLGVKSDDAPIIWKCGGTLITDRFVLTAAHCLVTNDVINLVRLGDLNLFNDTDMSEHKDYTVSDNIVHENYCPPATYHDIALMKLTEIVTFTDFIRPACLWTKPWTDIKNKTLAMGWGVTSGDVVEQMGSKDLLKVELNIYPRALCHQRYYTSANRISNSQFPEGVISSVLCAGDLDTTSDTCSGDSGGPLISINKSNPCIQYAVGITSTGYFCGATNRVAVYTQVLSYLGWIVKKISENKQ